LQRLGAIAADRQAQGQAAAGLVAVETAQRRAIIALGIRLAAEKIEREAAIATDGRKRGAELLGALEVRQGRLRLPVGDRYRAHSGLRQGTFRIDLVGAGKKAGRGLRIADLERGLAGADQRTEILGVRCERADITRQRRCRGFVVGRIAALRSGWHGGCHDRCACARQERPNQLHLQKSPHHPSRAAENLTQTFLPRGFTVSRAG